MCKLYTIMELDAENLNHYIDDVSTSKTVITTKNCIRNALIELMVNQSFDKIKITEIAKRAGVSRMTFYRYYFGKDDVLNEMIDIFSKRIIALFTDSIFNNGEKHLDLSQFFAIIFDYLFNNREKVKTIVKAFNNQNIIAKFVKREYSGKDNYYIRYVQCAFESGINAVIISWVRNGFYESPKNMANVCNRLFGDLLKTLIENDTNHFVKI